MKPRKTYGLKPGELAALKRVAQITENSIIFRTGPEGTALAKYLFNALDTELPVFLLVKEGNGYSLSQHKNTPTADVTIEDVNTNLIAMYNEKK